MTTKVRNSVFETNSSSTHSITISRDSKQRDTLWVDNGVCTIYPGEFGWDVEEYTDAPMKASYCLTWIKEMRNRKREADMLKAVIKRVTGARVVKFEKNPDRDRFYPWGYIDHQSMDDGAGGVLIPAWESEETLEAFIFNRSSILRTDNDNHD